MEPKTRIGRLTLTRRFVGESGRVVWECVCGCRRTVTVDESRLDGTHPRQSRSCRSCESGQPADDDTPEPGSSNSGDSGESGGMPDISPLQLRGVEPDGRFRVRCQCGTDFVVSGKLLRGSKRIKRCAGCIK